MTDAKTTRRYAIHEWLASHNQKKSAADVARQFQITRHSANWHLGLLVEQGNIESFGNPGKESYYRALPKAPNRESQTGKHMKPRAIHLADIVSSDAFTVAHLPLVQLRSFPHSGRDG
jgi:predicted ArsR family transcriptional regulator